MIHFYLQMCIAHEEIEELMLIDDAFCKDEAAEIKSVERDVFFKASNATEKELIKDEPFCKAKTSTTSIAMAVATTGHSLQLHHGVVSFRGVNLIQENINSFHGTNWLTDNAIGFILPPSLLIILMISWWSYLQVSRCFSATLTPPPSRYTSLALMLAQLLLSL